MTKKHNYPKPKRPDNPIGGLKDWLNAYYLGDNDPCCRFGYFDTDGEFLWYKDNIICVKLTWTKDPIYCYEDGEGDSYQVFAIDHIIDYCEEWYANDDFVLIPFSECKNYTNIWDVSVVAEKNYWDGIEQAVNNTSVRIITGP